MTAAAYLLVFWYPEEINVSTRPGPRLGSLMLQGLWWLQLHGSNCSSLVIGVSVMRASTSASQACGLTTLLKGESHSRNNRSAASLQVSGVFLEVTLLFHCIRARCTLVTMESLAPEEGHARGAP